MNKLDLNYFSGLCAILLALIYIGAFIFFGVFWSYPYTAETAVQIGYLTDNHFLIGLIYFTIYTLFGVVLSVLVLALNEKHLTNKTHLVSQLGTLFGVVWVGLVIASGFISVIGLGSVVELASTNIERAAETWHIVMLLTESLGGGNELVGGIWVLLISSSNLSSNVFSKWLNYLGLFVGTSGIATVYPADILTEIFGISQIVWFVWVGFSLINYTKANNPIQADM
ncbi:hypothetical protein [Thalassotalea agariperforans]